MDPLLLRFLERITAVLIGGMAIYLGFRLFLAVPDYRDSAGKFTLPWDISIVMTRIGPGVFFALFGAAVVGLTLIRPVEISSEDEGKSHSVRYAGSRPALSDRSAHTDARALLQREMAVLNTIPQLLRAELPEHERKSIMRDLRRVKLALMRPVWGTADEGFGDVAEFEHWVQAGEPDPPPKGMDGALALYRYGIKGSNL